MNIVIIQIRIVVLGIQGHGQSNNT